MMQRAPQVYFRPKGTSNASQRGALRQRGAGDYAEFVQALSMLLENNELANIFSVCKARPLIPGGETGCSELPRKSNAHGSELPSPIKE